MLCIGIACSKVSAQFQGNNLGTYGRYSDLTLTSPLQESVGIGDFLNSASNVPLARLHVATFRMGPSSDNLINPFSEGILFRTDGDESLENSWHLFTGTDATTQTEQFRLFTDAGSTPYTGLRAFHGGLRFETGGSNIRMRINGTSTATVNGFNINNSGFVAITNNPMFWNDSGSPKTPFSLLHLAGSSVNYQQTGYRDWMIDGITFTTNNDLDFIGPRSVSTDVTEFVIGWTDNSSSSFGPDDLVFRFLSGDGTAGSGANSSLGTQIMRCAGADNGRVGVGAEFDLGNDFRPQRKLHVHDGGASNTTHAQLRLSHTLSASSPVCADFRVTNNGNLYLNCYGTEQRFGIEEDAPLERLDVNGNARIQEVPAEAGSCVIMARRVNPATPEDVVLRRLDLNGDNTTYLSGNGTWESVTAAQCDWDLSGTNDLSTGHPGACRTGDVFIGSASPGNTAKLWVSNNNDPVLSSKAGVSSRISATQTTWAFRGTTYGGSVYNRAIDVSVISAPAGANNYAVYADMPVNSATSYAIYGTSAGNNSWAGYFNGRTFSPTASWTASDMTLKTNISEYHDALDILEQIPVYSYHFNPSVVPQLNLDTLSHFGVMSQELVEILPDFVTEVTVPATYDEEGQVTHESASVLAVNYQEFIPLLIEGTKQLQAKIEELETKLSECCTYEEERSAGENPAGSSSEIPGDSQVYVMLGQNQPNPFTEQTLIPYRLPEGFKSAQILVYNAEGRLVKSENLGTASGSIVVLGENLSNGTYAYTLMVDGQPIQTKKMMKTK